MFSVADRIPFSYRTLLFLLAAALALAFGYAVAVSSTAGSLIIQLLAVLVIAGLAALAPIEFLLLLAVLSVMLADSWFIPLSQIYYARFVPMGMLAVRALLSMLTLRNTSRVFSLTFIGPTFIFAVFALISTIYSIDPSLTFQRSVSMLLVLVPLGIGLPYWVSDKSDAERLLKWTAGGALVAIAAALIYMYAVGDPRAWFNLGQYERFRGPFVNPNTQGLIAMLFFFPVLWWWRAARGRLGKTALGLITVLVLILVLISGSRGSIAGLWVGIILFFLLRGGFARVNPVLIAMILVIPTLALLLVPDIGLAVLRSGDSDRLTLWRRAIEIGMASPIWGIGFAASDRLFVSDSRYLLSIGIATGGSHSSIFRMFVDLGVAGVVLGYLAFIAVFFRLVRETAARKDLFAAGLAAAVLAGLVDALFEDWLYGFGSSSTFPLWFFLALLALVIELSSRPVPDGVPAPDVERIADEVVS